MRKIGNKSTAVRIEKRLKRKRKESRREVETQFSKKCLKNDVKTYDSYEELLVRLCATLANKLLYFQNEKLKDNSNIF